MKYIVRNSITDNYTMNRVKGKWQKMRRQVTKAKANEGESPRIEGDAPATAAPVASAAPSRWQKLIVQLQEEERLRSLATRDVDVNDVATSSSPPSPAGDKHVAVAVPTTATVQHGVAVSAVTHDTSLGGGETAQFPKMSQTKGRWLKLRKQITADMAREKDTCRDVMPICDTPSSHAKQLDDTTAGGKTRDDRDKQPHFEHTNGHNNIDQSSNASVDSGLTGVGVENGTTVGNASLVANGSVQSDSLADTSCSGEARKTTSVKGRWLKLKTRVTTANRAVEQLQQVHKQTDGAPTHSDVTRSHGEMIVDDVPISQQNLSDKTCEAIKRAVRVRKPRQVSWSHNHPTSTVIPYRSRPSRAPIIATRHLLTKSMTPRHCTSSSSFSSGYSSSLQMTPDSSDVMDGDLFWQDSVDRT